MTGDVNRNLLNYKKNPETHFFIEQIFTSNFLYKLLFPTNVIKYCAILTDNILINKEEVKTTCSNFTTSTLVHLPQFLIMEDLLQNT